MGLISMLKDKVKRKMGQVPGNPQAMPWRPTRPGAPPPPGGMQPGPMPPNPVTGPTVKPIPGTGPMPPHTPPVSPIVSPRPSDPGDTYRRDFHRRARMHLN